MLIRLVPLVATLWALSADGAFADPWDLDPSFDGDGTVLTDFGGDNEQVAGVAIQADQKIVVAGNDNGAIEVARYNPDGSLDSGFDGDGKVETTFPGGTPSASGVAIQADGKIVVGGTLQGVAPADTHTLFAVVRYDTDGTLDETFSGDGRQTADVGAGNDYGFGVAIQADQKIVVAGSSNDAATGGDFAVARFKTNGTPDETFSGDGEQSTDFGSGASYREEAFGVAIHDGKIVLAGTYLNASAFDFALARYTSTGELDGTFSDDGKQRTPFPDATASGNAVAIQSDGKPVVVGGYSFKEFLVARYKEDGTLDGTFSGDGWTTTNFTPSQDGADAVAIQDDGKIVVAGHAAFDGFALARYNADGTPDETFSEDGKQTETFFEDGSEANAVAIQADSKLVAAGRVYAFADSDFGVARFEAQDLLAPETTITGGPDGTTTNPTPSFTFESDEDAATFECRVDADALVPCFSPYTTTPLEEGGHTVEVRATDAAGNVDETPATRSFTVDLPPDTSITGGPSGVTADATPEFSFTSSQPGGGFQCRVDGGAFGACSSPHTTATLGDGGHTFEVAATDPGGNVDPSPASRGFTVDTTPPETTIFEGPSGTTTNRTPSFSFGADDPSAGFACSLDGGAFAACTSPYATGALANGPHTFAVRATDGLGNADPSPAERSFTVADAPPTGGGTDTDADGLADAFDLCPATSDVGAPQSPHNGCPAVSQPPVTQPPATTDPDEDGPTAGDDVLRGTGAGETICGLLGDDVIDGRGGNDRLYGDACGVRKRVALAASAGGDDTLVGGLGNGTLVGGPGRNVYRGGPGNDRFDARNGTRDKLDCGPGRRDRARVDRVDKVKRCEKVRRSR